MGASTQHRKLLWSTENAGQEDGVRVGITGCREGWLGGTCPDQPQFHRSQGQSLCPYPSSNLRLRNQESVGSYLNVACEGHGMGRTVAVFPMDE